MVRRALLLIAAACGSAPPPAAPRVESTQPPQPAAPTSCADAGVILRGHVNEDGERAGPEREAAIAKLCETGRWSAAVLECIGSEPDAHACLLRLPPRQRHAYDAASREWATAEDDDIGDIQLSCDDMLADSGPSDFPPVLAGGTPEHEWNMGVRRRLISHECDHGWSQELLRCLLDATGPMVAGCLHDELDPGEVDELTKKLAEVDRLAGRIAAARKKPAAIGCKEVVTAHYADANWRNKLDGFKPAERKRMIAASRALMTKACTADSWDETLRACVVAGGNETCFESFHMAREWGYPAAGSVVSVGIADCDTYGATLANITTCDKLPRATRDELSRNYEEMKAHIASKAAAERAKLASGCRAGDDAIKEIAAAAGC